MDVKFAVALDQPAQARDFAVAAGDDFRVLLDVYQADNEDSIDPVDLTGFTLTLKVSECAYPPLAITTPGATEAAFVFVPANTADTCGRQPYRIFMVDPTGKRTTLAHGVMVVFNDRRCGWPDGSDYGWRYGRGWPA
ncbi:hypothetical protein [Burkholderia seminalis]|uniref:hypothetical protein n=1 Tax=Burkholderia seminalis TaxID=488731 RepID=UPI000F5967C1|nr:hypothetical protein [Burkholderia seminalis]RQS88070.1 hypothetical protein DF048_27500 [Burkholderia seminalis]